MSRLLLTLFVGLFSLVAGAAHASAEVCPESDCRTLLIVEATVAPAAAEAEVRERDENKLQPPTPEFWMQFRSYAYKQLPKHQDQNFQAVWVAMPIDTSDGTVPTLGLKGVWW